MNTRRIAKATKMLIESLGYSLQDENFKNTPARVANFWKEFFKEGIEDIEPISFIGLSNMIVIREIKFYSMCPHHILPWFGDAYVAYIPMEGKVIGLSKIVRAVYKWTRRLILQETATNKILSEILNITDSENAMVILKAQHMCMMIRGVKNLSHVVTSSIAGEFWKHEVREEALRLMGLT